MIENAAQLALTKAQSAKFKKALASASEDPPTDALPVIWRAYKDGLDSQLKTLQNEIDEFEQSIGALNRSV